MPKRWKMHYVGRFSMYVIQFGDKVRFVLCFLEENYYLSGQNKDIRSVWTEESVQHKNFVYAPSR